jgi:hypothetical protein
MRGDRVVPVTCPARSTWAKPGFRLSQAALAANSGPAISIAVIYISSRVSRSTRSSSFDNAILRGRGWCNRPIPDAHGAQSVRDNAAKDPVAIADEVTRRLVPWKRFRRRSGSSEPRTGPWRQCLARGYARRSAIPGWAAPAVGDSITSSTRIRFSVHTGAFRAERFPEAPRLPLERRPATRMACRCR